MNACIFNDATCLESLLGFLFTPDLVQLRHTIHCLRCWKMFLGLLHKVSDSSWHALFTKVRSDQKNGAALLYLGWSCPNLTGEVWVQKCLHSLVGNNLFSTLFPIINVTSLLPFPWQMFKWHSFILPIQIFTARTHHAFSLYYIGKKEVPLSQFLLKNCYWMELTPERMLSDHNFNFKSKVNLYWLILTSIPHSVTLYFKWLLGLILGEHLVNKKFCKKRLGKQIFIFFSCFSHIYFCF